MTLANRITITRMFLSLIIFALIISRSLWAEISALALLTIATISDYVDGVIARKTMTTTPFGAIADPFADKILIMAVFLAFASIRELTVPLWAVFLILLRELTISTLRVLAALHGEVMKAERAGKLKTLVQMICAFVILVLFVIRTWAKTHWIPYGFLRELSRKTPEIAYWLTVFSAAVTVISGVIYLYTHSDLLEKSWSEKKKKPQADNSSGETAEK